MAFTLECRNCSEKFVSVPCRLLVLMHLLSVPTASILYVLLVLILFGFVELRVSVHLMMLAFHCNSLLYSARLYVIMLYFEPAELFSLGQ